MTVKLCVAAVITAASAWAQDVPLDLFASLEPKSTEHVAVSLDAGMLQFAAGFLGSDPQITKIKAIVAGLKGIYVRSLTFANEGDYSRADVDKIRTRLKGWNKIVEVHESGEDTGIYVKTDGQTVQGVVILSAEAKELTLVNIAGNIRLEDLKALSGKFGIPDLGDLSKEAGQKKKEEE